MCMCRRLTDHTRTRDGLNPIMCWGVAVCGVCVCANGGCAMILIWSIQTCLFIASCHIAGGARRDRLSSRRGSRVIVRIRCIRVLSSISLLIWASVYATVSDLVLLLVLLFVLLIVHNMSLVFVVGRAFVLVCVCVSMVVFVLYMGIYILWL